MRHLQARLASFKYWHISFVNSSAWRTTACSLLVGIIFFSVSARGVDVWVSPLGDDANPGTASAPVATIARAQQKARDFREAARTYDYQQIRIVLHGGWYPVTRELLFRPEDSGDRTNPLVISAAPGEKPVLSLAAARKFTVGNWLPACPACRQWRSETSGWRMPRVSTARFWNSASFG